MCKSKNILCLIINILGIVLFNSGAFAFSRTDYSLKSSVFSYNNDYRDYTNNDYSAYRYKPQSNRTQNDDEDEDYNREEDDRDYDDEAFDGGDAAEAGSGNFLTFALLAGGAYYVYDSTQSDDADEYVSPFETVEYNKIRGLSMIKASAAYDIGAKGAGILVAVIDDGVDITNPDLAANISPLLAFDGLDSNVTNLAGHTVDDVSQNAGDYHGTFVASIIAGVRNDSGIHGVAYGSQILPIKIGYGDAITGDYDPVAAFTVALANNSRVVNNSYGVNEDYYAGTGPNTANIQVFPYTADAITYFDANKDGQLLGAELTNATNYWNRIMDTTVDIAYINTTFGKTATEFYTYGTNSYVSDGTSTSAVLTNANGQAFLNSMDNFATAGTIIVWAAGNSYLSQSSIENAVPYLVPTIKGLFITAVALEEDGGIAAYSDWCGVAKDWCISAPGFAYAVDVTNPSGYSYDSGTSFASAYVSGAAAVLLTAYPELTSREVVAILFDSANKSGIYANTAIYGQGALDLAAAVNPLGTTTMATTRSVVGPSVDYSKTRLYTSSAISLADLGVDTKTTFFLDKYDRDYSVPLSDLVQIKEKSTSVESVLANFGAYSKGATYNLGGVNFEYALSPEIYVQEAENTEEDTLPKLRYFGFSTNLQNGGAAEFAYARPEYLKALTFTEAITSENSLSQNGVVNPYLDFQDETLGFNIDAYKSKKISFNLATVYGLFASDTSNDGEASDNSDKNSSLSILAKGSYNLSGNEQASLHFGMVNEFSSMLGSTMDSGFALAANTKTYFTGASYEAKADSVSFFANYMLGVTEPETVEGSLIKNMSTLYSSSFALGLSVQTESKLSEKYGLVISSPLAVTKGKAEIFLPISRDDVTDEISYELINANLAPTSRELDVETFYTVGEANLNLSLGLMHRFNADNIAGANDSIAMLKLNAVL
jgi:subtilisin family serine protease